MRKTRILVVEEDPAVRRELLAILRGRGYVTGEADSGARAIATVRREPPHLLLLGASLPDMDGLDLLSVIRREHEFPVIIVSGRSDEAHAIQAFDEGASDYVTLPLREGELLARIRARLRQGSDPSTELVAGDLRIDTLERRVFVADREVALTPTEWKLLYLLARQPGHVLTHPQLLEEVWGSAHVGDLQYLRVYVKQMRQKLEENPAKPRRLLTVLGVGYRLAPR